MQNLVAASHTPWAYVGGPVFVRGWSLLIRRVGGSRQVRVKVGVVKS